MIGRIMTNSPTRSSPSTKESSLARVEAGKEAGAPLSGD